MSISVNSEKLLWRFRDNLASLFKTRRPRGIAIALSGGVDSMALAWLCHQWNILRQPTEDIHLAKPVTIQAIIVNHKLRQESDDEALATSDRYQKLTGRTPLTLTLDWNAYDGNATTNALETHARRLRYRALGLACREHQLDMIFTGHHQDDNAETVLLRIINGARNIGLHGIAPLARIPECDDLYGVAERADPDQWKTRGSAQKGPQNLGVLEPSVHLARPLLNFNKSELASICRTNDVTWAEDSSNNDFTLTERNTVRHLLKSGSLPKAFNKPALIDLARIKQDELHQEKLVTERLMSQSDIVLDIRSGVLSVIPSNEIRSKHLSWAVKRRFVRDLALAVSSKSELGLRDFDIFTEQILAIDSSVQRNLKLTKSVDPRVWRSPDSSTGGVVAAICLGWDHDKRPIVMWRFTRQALTRNESERCRLTLTKALRGLTTPDSPNLTRWDGRFWLNAVYSRTSLPQRDVLQEKSIGLKGFDGTMANSPSTCTLAIREWKVEDLTHLRRLAKCASEGTLRDNALKALNNYNQMLRFNNMKLVLPVLVETDGQKESAAMEKLVAVPALGYTCPTYQDHLQFEVAFKSTGDVKGVSVKGWT